MGVSVSNRTSQPFRPRARVLQLLGDELIGSARLAVFELVKNAYDADANGVTVTLDLDSPPEPTITVADDGEGMTLDTLRSVWLVLGDDHRRRQRRAQRRTARHGRLPLGEKGVGRLAAHKLGSRIVMTTRAAGAEECVVDIDWNEMIERPFLDEAPVTITTRVPRSFPGCRTGTRIDIRDLREKHWTRGEVRRLHNQILSICSPFDESDRFRVALRVPRHEQWVADLPDMSGILDQAIWKFSFRLDGGAFDWNYEFRGAPGVDIESRRAGGTGESLQLPPRPGERAAGDKVVADEAVTAGIGPVSGTFFVYDRDREIRKRLPNIRLLESYLNDMGGVRVYRDGIRVYNYGELGDDWLGLDLRRVNMPTRRISRNIVLGAVDLSLRDSTDLVEKTNREGFVENDARHRLRRIVLGALAALENERQIDKARVQQLTARPRGDISDRIDKPVADLRRALERLRMADRFGKHLERIETYYRNMQETLLSAGMSGLNLTVVFHEVERGVRMLHRTLAAGGDRESAESQARDLMRLLDGFAALVRRDSKKEHTARKLVEGACRFNALRFRYHRIRFCSPFLDGEAPGFRSRFAFNLVLGALDNLVDNALYWLRVRWPEEPRSDGSRRRLYIDISRDLKAGPAIVVADNGPGYRNDDPDRLTRPFFTRKPDGMGLGLYYANLAMELNGGRLAFPEPGEVEIPPEFDGAVAALVFKEIQS